MATPIRDAAIATNAAAIWTSVATPKRQPLKSSALASAGLLDLPFAARAASPTVLVANTLPEPSHRLP
ncbi:hypothetical protein [Caballeronia sp. GAWG2-1]|uniref:hypothetical protein n=1 Tax=Caballeronia sp. GAWG2-1 TaxID=2921744 RepID=UPI00202858EE|nr:hypothetical protein [Caballeronia sp. GAWG2-1]